MLHQHHETSAPRPQARGPLNNRRRLLFSGGRWRRSRGPFTRHSVFVTLARRRPRCSASSRTPSPRRFVEDQLPSRRLFRRRSTASSTVAPSPSSRVVLVALRTAAPEARLRRTARSEPGSARSHGLLARGLLFGVAALPVHRHPAADALALQLGRVRGVQHDLPAGESRSARCRERGREAQQQRDDSVVIYIARRASSAADLQLLFKQES